MWGQVRAGQRLWLRSGDEDLLAREESLRLEVWICLEDLVASHLDTPFAAALNNGRERVAFLNGILESIFRLRLLL